MFGVRKVSDGNIPVMNIIETESSHSQLVPRKNNRQYGVKAHLNRIPF